MSQDHATALQPGQQSKTQSPINKQIKTNKTKLESVLKAHKGLPLPMTYQNLLTFHPATLDKMQTKNVHLAMHLRKRKHGQIPREGPDSAYLFLLH